MRTAFAALVCVFVPAVLHAQSDVRPLPRNDATVSTGWIGARHPHPADTYDDWHGSLFGGIGFGRYWTDHLKTEIEAGWLSTVKSERYQTVVVGLDPTYAESDVFFKDLRLSLAQSVQFGHNAWIHPFLGAGVDVDYLRTIEDRATQVNTIFLSSRDSRSVVVPEVHARETRFRAVPFVKGGFKFYITDRTFVVQEFKFGLANGVDHVLWKTGLGIDF